MSAPLVKSLNLEIKGVAPSHRLAGLIVLGTELLHKKREFGYDGPGSWQAFREESKSGTRPPWTEYCATQAGISDVMAAHYHQCGEAVRLRLRFSHKPEAKDLLAEMQVQPSTLSTERRISLIQRIETIGLKRGDTQSFLRKEYRTAQLPKQHERSIPEPVTAEDEREELYEMAIRLKPFLEAENQRRSASVLARLALRALPYFQQKP